MNTIQSQQYDNVWCMGYESNGDSTTDFGGQNIDFRYDPPRVFYRNREADFDVTSGSICDESGNLLFYTNGCKIYNAEDAVIEGGDSLTAMDNYWTTKFWCPYGFTLQQGVLILPDPYNSGEYYLLHQDVNLYPNSYPKMDELYMTKIDMKLNNGKGKVILKRTLLLSELSTAGGISAIRHSNGKDWWVVISTLKTSRLNIFLLNINGLQLHSHQDGISKPLNFDLLTLSSKFSHDGKLFARFNISHGIELFDFDRMTGSFSNPRFLPFWEVLVSGQQLGDGLEFSPDSKKLYANYNTSLFQFDLSAQDVFGSLQLIDTLRIDTTEFFRPSFYQMQLAPNNKIYMSTLNGQKLLHIIHQPNELGKACSFEQRGFKLKTWNAFTMPYFPNFRLGPDTTVGVVDINHPESLRIYPNPSHESIYLSGMRQYQGKQIKIINQQGILMKQEILQSNWINIADLSDGLFILQCGDQATKFIKIN